jgi:hypothetical protein
VLEASYSACSPEETKSKQNLLSTELIRLLGKSQLSRVSRLHRGLKLSQKIEECTVAMDLQVNPNQPSTGPRTSWKCKFSGFHLNTTEAEFLGVGGAQDL